MIGKIHLAEGNTMHKLFSIRPLLLALGMLLMSGVSSAQIGVGISVSFGPPELPVYEQPLCPADGYIWVPGYWAWDGDDYYWVPGTWVEAPEVGFLWTPGYWGWGGSAFFFHEGYWGPRVGFYGGINYGFGYFGHGYEGGRWDRDRFYYNRSVNNVNITEIHNVYNTRIENNYRETRVSYSGGNGGINERATAEEEAAARERHIGPVATQTRHIEAARGNPSLHASQNHGKPAIAATPRPAAFNDRGVVAARSGGNYNPPARGANNASRPPEARTGNNVSRPADARHPNELPPITRSAPRDSGNASADRKYQQQQDKMYAKQEQDRAKLQQKQEQEHQRIAQQNANESRRQQVEQLHQQQTQQLVQKHVQQQQRMEQRQPQPRQSQPPNPKEKH
jgi:hypothetical protein